MQIDGESFNPQVRNIDKNTNQYTFDRKMIRAFKSLEGSIKLATDQGFNPWTVKKEVPKIKEHFLTKKHEWKERNSYLEELSLPSISISSTPKPSTEIFKEALPSLVTIETTRGSGSGFLLPKNTFLPTATSLPVTKKSR